MSFTSLLALSKSRPKPATIKPARRQWPEISNDNDNVAESKSSFRSGIGRTGTLTTVIKNRVDGNAALPPVPGCWRTTEFYPIQDFLTLDLPFDRENAPQDRRNTR
jgi:hypothetical protein